MTDPRRVVTRLTQDEQDRIINAAVRRAHAGKVVVSGSGGGSGSGSPSTTDTAPFVPMRIFAGRTFLVPENTQCLAAFPITVEPGATLEVSYGGALAFVS